MFFESIRKKVISHFDDIFLSIEAQYEVMLALETYLDDIADKPFSRSFPLRISFAKKFGEAVDALSTANLPLSYARQSPFFSFAWFSRLEE